MKRKGFQTISLEMIKIIERTHKFTTQPWTSVYGITYIGFGHKNLLPLQKISRLKAKELLRKELEDISLKLTKLLKKEILQQHFDVFCHIIYDHSFTAFKNSSLYLEYLEDNLYKDVTSNIMIWSKIKGNYSQAMIYRRQHDLRVYKDKNYEVKTK